MIKISALNIQSLKPKISELSQELNRFDYDFAILSETWLKPSIPNRLLVFPGYTLKRADRSTKPLGHGGVATLFRDSYVCKTIRVTSSDDPVCKLESLWSLFTWSTNRRLIIAALYRPPRRTISALDADFTLLEQQYQDVLVSYPDCHVLLAGDLNCDWLAEGPSKRFLVDFVTKYSLFHHISEPTFSSGSAIDVIITNRDTVTRKGTRFCHFSPHLFTRVMIDVPRFRHKPRVVDCRSFKRFSLHDFETDLLATDWSCVFAAEDTSAAWSDFIHLFNPIVNRHAPVRTVKLHNPTAPPVSDATHQLMADRARALRMWGHGTDVYRDANRLARAAFRADKRRHIGHRLSEQGRTSVWRCVGEVVGSKKGAAVVPPSVSAEAMNDFFVHVGPRVAAELAAQGTPPALPPRLPRVGACAFRLNPITITTLHNIISTMKNSPSRGSDGLCIRVIKLSFNSISHVLLHLVNSCLISNVIPEAWKHSLVHPIPKSGDPADPSNYRPISIIPVISKIVERAVQRQLYYYLSSNHLLSPSQHGFRPRHSTETALTCVTDSILSATDSGHISILCLIDLSKCFDVISHSKLLEKLQLLGVDVSWFQNYLFGHTQSVSLTSSDGRTKTSTPLPINQGVFQGSSLGPVLFCAFANDLSLYVSDALIVQYADDTQVLVSGPKSDVPALVSRMERALSSLGDYFHSNGLKVNVSKFELITFGSRQNLRNISPINVMYKNTRLTPSTEVKNLGVIFDQHLSWDAHVRTVSRRCCGILAALSHLRHFLPPDTLPEIVTALAVSHIRYCLTVYGSGSAGNLSAIQKILNFAARVVAGRRKFDRVRDVRVRLGWLDSPQLFQYQSLCLLDKIISSGQPESIAHQICSNRTHRDHARSTRQDSLLHLPPIRTEAGRRRFVYRSAHLRNALPEPVRSLSGLRFRKALRAHLLAVRDDG